MNIKNTAQKIFSIKDFFSKCSENFDVNRSASSLWHMSLKGLRNCILCVISAWSFFWTVLCKSAFSNYSFGKLVFRVLWFLFVLLWTWCHLNTLCKTCIITVDVDARYLVILFPIYKNHENRIIKNMLPERFQVFLKSISFSKL